MRPLPSGSSALAALLTAGLAALLLSSPPVEAAEEQQEPVVRVTGGTAFEALPDINGASRVRLRNDMWARFALHRRWSLVVAGNLRFGRRLNDDGPADRVKFAGEGIDEADLYRFALRYSAPELTITAGRFVRIAGSGPARVDGISVEVGGRSVPVGAEVWFGRLGHFEAMTPVTALAGGVDALLLPPGPRGGRGVAVIRLGYDFHKSVPGLRHHWHGEALVRSGTGSSLGGGAEVGLLPAASPSGQDDLGLRAWVRGTLAVDSRLRIIGGFRWEDLPPSRVPETSLPILEALVPRGYAVGHVDVELWPGAVQIRVGGGPTLLPSEEGAPRIGGTGKASVDLPLGAGRFGFFGAGTSVAGSGYVGGGVGSSGAIGPLYLVGDVGAYRMAGLDRAPGLVLEGRLAAELVLPLPARIALATGDLRVIGSVAGGTDRLLAPWIRAGIGVRGSISLDRRSRP
jgi:hypothetical protein